ncbi:MAG: efflux RND transporter periplasmic adaptor subunit [Porticoccaceae bacterium]|nr:efflux RND transporter periplasmic adaptor subunit [Porticoccaceae bacterium]
MTTLKKVLLPIALIAVAAVISITITILRPAPLKLEAPDTAVAVKTLILFSQSADLLVESQGTVLPRTKTKMISEVSGAVLSLSPEFVVGGTFAAGDILLQLDPTDYEVALQRAEARLISMNAQATFELARGTQAQKEWAMTGRPTDEAPLLALREPYLAEARANVLQAEAEVKQAKLKLARTTIRAPYLGMVAAKTVDIGQYVTVGTALGEIFAIDSAEVRLPLTEKDLARIDLDTHTKAIQLPAVTLKATVAAKPRQWKARVVRSEGVVDQLNRSQYLVAQIDDPYALNNDSVGASWPLLMGTFVRAEIVGKRIDNVYAVPRHALMEGRRVALVDSDQRLRITPVKTSHGDDQFYYIDSGLEDGAEIIVSAMGAAIEGMLIKPVGSTN